MNSVICAVNSIFVSTTCAKYKGATYSAAGTVSHSIAARPPCASILSGSRASGTTNAGAECEQLRSASASRRAALKGPAARARALEANAVAAADVVEWEYAKAVAARRAGDKAASLTALGRALHLVQGLTVPHHSADLP